MSWQDSVVSEELTAYASHLEAARFGVSVDRMVIPANATRVSVEDVRQQLERSSADVVILRYPAARVGWFAELSRSSRCLILADSLTCWEMEPGDGRDVTPAGSLSVALEFGIAPALLDALVADIFVDYGNHYLANPLFDAQKALAGYQEWVRYSVAKDGAVVLRRSGEPVAVATVEVVDDTMEILLAGVVRNAQGQGLYAHLLKGVEDLARTRGVKHLVISTQGHNTHVQRAWCRFGFEPTCTLLTVHLLRKDSASLAS